MDDIIRNLDNQKRWLSMAMDDFRDVSGIEQKIAKYRDSLNDAWPLLQAHPYGAAARAYLAEQERLFVFKQATEQAERQISQAKSQLRYAEMSLEREPERAKQQVAQALSIANGLLADPQYASLPIVQSFAPAFLEGPAREMHIKVNSAAILQEAENSLRTSKSHLRWVKGYIEGNNAESAERYLKMALDAAKPLQADPKFLAVPEVAAYLEELKMAEEAYTPKITSLALQSQFETDQREVTYLQKQIGVLKPNLRLFGVNMTELPLPPQTGFLMSISKIRTPKSAPVVTSPS
ncbi:hypothetical protein M427DRAFT_172452 [Gonapodya prolifera JEL478]|uniref:Uncharacterized protein n=1 Tax=Gonapodya prolifera (strain JEL478) TaxID=1344416 RepID=A0A139B0V7_GONPJ|nr:hypothetical protein M427DRAFT_172452 [Gonapodya prolifera JEL478]|eukprot:KXS22433.1 hypothetical protein M427DRAFT_172452 [Gonapodya prolifera JEL478]